MTQQKGKGPSARTPGPKKNRNEFHRRSDTWQDNATARNAQACGRLIVQVDPYPREGEAEAYYAFARDRDLHSPSRIWSITGDGLPFGRAFSEALAWLRGQLETAAGDFDKVVIVAPTSSRLCATDEHGKHPPIGEVRK